MAEIYARMHEDRFGIAQERERLAQHQAELAEADDLMTEMAQASLNCALAMGQILELIEKTAKRYSDGSVTRAALDTLVLDIVDIVTGK